MTLEFRRMPKHGRSTQRYSYEVTDAGGKFQWLADGRSLVYIDKFLNGEYCFEVWFTSGPGELEGWLKRYVAEKPEEALPLLADMLQELAIASRKKDAGKPSSPSATFPA